MLPFTRAQFLEVFALYNEAVWPAQLALLAAALAAIALARRGGADRAVGAILALLWAWTAVAYHLAFFTRINPAAWLFGALWLTGAAAFAWHGAWRARLAFDWRGPGAAIGKALLALALVAYPIAGWMLGHRYPAAPTFGAPCPAAIFTLGMLCFLRPGAPRAVFAAPVLWALVAAGAAFVLGMYEDLSLPLAGAALAWSRRARYSTVR